MKHISNYEHKYSLMLCLSIIPILITVLLNIGIYTNPYTYAFMNSISTALTYVFVVISIMLFLFKDRVRWFDRVYGVVWSILLISFDLLTRSNDSLSTKYKVSISKPETFFLLKLCYTNIDLKTIEKTTYIFSYISFFSIVSVLFILVLSLINIVRVKKQSNTN